MDRREALKYTSDRRKPQGPIAEIAEISADDLKLTVSALRHFAAAHGDSEEQAANGLRDTFDALAEAGWLDRRLGKRPVGRSALYAQGFLMEVDSDFTTVIGYFTERGGRTLDEVRESEASGEQEQPVGDAPVEDEALEFPEAEDVETVRERVAGAFLPAKAIRSWSLASKTNNQRTRDSVHDALGSADLAWERQDAPDGGWNWVADVPGPDGQAWRAIVKPDARKVVMLEPVSEILGDSVTLGRSLRRFLMALGTANAAMQSPPTDPDEMRAMLRSMRDATTHYLDMLEDADWPQQHLERLANRAERRWGVSRSPRGE